MTAAVGCSACAHVGAQDCLAAAETQMEMNRYAGDEYKKADAELNRIYKQIQTVYSDDRIFLSKLRDSQRAWIRFRDAELAMLYPRGEGVSDYGSIGSMCRSMFLEKMTRERVAALRAWLTGAAEGDVCSGSIGSAQKLLPSNERDK
ncbi:MAG: lysozyme inhibitor LprI family protein [Gammaproteobacteria bacterium]